MAQLFLKLIKEAQPEIKTKTTIDIEPASRNN